MTGEHSWRVAIVYPGDEETRRNATASNNRFAPLFSAFAESGIQAEPAVYHDDVCQAVRDQLLQVDGVLVWVNPIEDGHDRSLLDATLREVADAGIFVSAHPDIILKLGTKEVIYQTRELGWGSDTYLYRTLEQLARELPGRLTTGKARVLKQYRGHSGIGVWKVSPLADPGSSPRASVQIEPQPSTIIRVRHAQRGSIEEELTLEAFIHRCEPYFAGEGRVIDQEYQERLPEGMVRCYLAQNRVAGFGHQAVNALYPAPEGVPPGEAPQPGPRLYYPPTQPEFQAVKQQLEHDWLPAAQQLLGIPTERLPILWDCDFLLGPKSDDGTDTYVLCEINVSSVAPYPDAATSLIVEATQAQMQRAKQHRRASTESTDTKR